MLIRLSSAITPKVINNEFFDANVDVFLEETFEFQMQLSLIRLLENDT